MSSNLILGLSILFALLPVFVWSYIFFDTPKDKNRGLYFKIFLGGTLTVLPVLFIQYAYLKIIGQFPSLDFVSALYASVGVAGWIAIKYSFVALIEEVIKFYIVLFSDKNYPELITNISQALKFGILAGLGFAFSENILYFSNNWSSLETSGLISLILFRSVFTVCAHICFSGIFSYFYGISKFSKDFIEFKKWTGQTISTNEYQKFRNKQIAIGFTLSIFFHGAFNSILEVGTILGPPTFNLFGKAITFNIYIVGVVLLVAGMFLTLQTLLSKNTGNLVFILADRYKSTMSKKDEDVILELMGIWYNQGRYEEVKSICERLLKRDPDNNVVKIFQAKIQDKLL